MLRDIESVDITLCRRFHKMREAVVAFLVWFMEFQIRLVLVSGEVYARGWGRNIQGSRKHYNGQVLRLALRETQ